MSLHTGIKRQLCWCNNSYLELNTTWTVEMIVDFWKFPPPPPSTTLQGTSCMFLGSIISKDFKWESNTDSVIKMDQRMFCGWTEPSTVNADPLPYSYQWISSHLLHHGLVQLNTKQSIQRLQRVIWAAEKVIGYSRTPSDSLSPSRIKRTKTLLTPPILAMHSSKFSLQRGGSVPSEPTHQDAKTSSAHSYQTSNLFVCLFLQVF